MSYFRSFAISSQTETVTTTETTTSASYTDLATTGPDLDVTPGPSGTCLVLITSQMRNTTNGSGARASVDLSGGNTLAAADDRAIYSQDTNPFTLNRFLLITGLTQASTTFRMKYKADANTGEFSRRTLVVMTW